MIAEIPDPRCVEGAAPIYAQDVARTRLAFVKTYGIPPVTHSSGSPISRSRSLARRSSTSRTGKGGLEARSASA
ncbi:hypothetical protein EPN42_05160 [bacterium]|nr:MAG: hypothetical protein EPN42_05160 [bacterium]